MIRNHEKREKTWYTDTHVLVMLSGRPHIWFIQCFQYSFSLIWQYNSAVISKFFQLLTILFSTQVGAMTFQVQTVKSPKVFESGQQFMHLEKEFVIFCDQ